MNLIIPNNNRISELIQANSGLNPAVAPGMNVASFVPTATSYTIPQNASTFTIQQTAQYSTYTFETISFGSATYDTYLTSSSASETFYGSAVPNASTFMTNRIGWWSQV